MFLTLDVDDFECDALAFAAGFMLAHDYVDFGEGLWALLEQIQKEREKIENENHS